LRSVSVHTFFGKDDSFYKKLADKTLYNNYFVRRIFEKDYFRHKLYKKGFVNTYYYNICTTKYLELGL